MSLDRGDENESERMHREGTSGRSRRLSPKQALRIQDELGKSGVATDVGFDAPIIRWDCPKCESRQLERA